MSVTSTLRAAALGLTCLAFAACSKTEGNEINATSIAKNILKGRKKAAKPDVNAVAVAAANILATTDKAAILISLPKRDLLSVVQEIETNRGYITFGSPDRRSITLKNGMLTATRGLGNDVLSSDIGGVHALISARHEGAAQRAMRYLDGENLTVEMTPFCQIKLGKTTHVSIGEINSPAQIVLESCIADHTTFQNTYHVAPNGRILQSQQWHSPFNDYIVLQALR